MNTRARSFLLAAAAWCACMVSMCAKKEPPVAATVAGEKVYVRDIEQMIDRYVSVYRKVDTTFVRPQGAALEDMRRQFLDGIIDKIIILKKAAALAITVSDEELNTKIDLLKKTNGIMDEETFGRYLTEQKISAQEFRKNIRDIMVMEKTRDKLFEDIAVPDSETQAYYSAHASEFQAEKMRAAHILFIAPDRDIPEQKMLSFDNLVKRKNSSLAGEALIAKVKSERDLVRKKAEDVAEKAKKGADFAALARKYSEGPTAKQGGDLGEFNKGDMIPEFDAVVFSLKKGQIAGPVKTMFGYQIIKALSDPYLVSRSIESVKDNIKKRLLAEKKIQQLKSLRTGENVTVLWNYKD
ncbi:MAG: hypothetical protein A2268_10665 [Candidatus Raymondbacteria bacterium RifOxyA12_full_50_37]|uniref:PpiC domain-containing protein n=1 Tax=Candidatus Raymondbacteria bacterium RIFOXYD12_FULL_49_13 TaxID=1817890 RepID=A0A1F7F8V9_UNCRA|nr:MAG: hypothetical protein A2268_10665 [Candidatus Raymondbacteria bacterium RifOxyA12_full_50_37]OGJ85426.1 MAG: hypothetical protein A2248_12450 [Candidatus Raymondbacteria bacterium RIFOXYA2_FULL_49_16]OGJ91054.1 MAG: hypothetical protein A2350_07460 [Candidatus Raymondbacteria bacterium RifOxyB12_full_50_8]OGJ94934.1 MAG: hypothetical protein A2453_07920 [Candidatus Raymondbacteria bacterium RIFOXYC2_FULL_50_21]OGJ98691.1 MAG: hypothetical protein A2487_05770 [Candidatus Raymondbacteria b